MRVNIKPLSVNKCWQGRRYKTKEYKRYEQDLFNLLSNLEIKKNTTLYAYYEFGLSNNLCDFDNPVKPLQDILQKKYGFNDNKIECAFIRKVLIDKGKEYFSFYFFYTLDELKNKIASNYLI